MGAMKRLYYAKHIKSDKSPETNALRDVLDGWKGKRFERNQRDRKKAEMLVAYARYLRVTGSSSNAR